MNSKNATLCVLVLSVIVVASLMFSSLAIVPVAATSKLTANPAVGIPQVPGAPMNLVADPGPGYVWLWWNHPATNGDQLIKKYEIYRGVTSNGENATAHDWVYVGSSYYQGTYLGGVNFYNDTTNITNGTTYFYKVKATSDSGLSAFSNEASAKADVVGTAPGAPTVTATNHVYSATVNWTHPASNGTAPVRFYFLYRNFGNGVPFNETLASWLLMPGYVDDSVLPGQFYNYTVTAVSTYGEGTPSTEMTFVGGTGSLPGAPQNLTAFGSNHTVFLSWDNPVNPSAHGITNYTVFRSLSATSGFVYIGNFSTEFFLFTFFEDATATNGVTYYYEVAANNANGAGPFSNVANATPSLTILPFKVYLANAYPGDTQILLTWSTVFNATGYEIFRGTTAGGEGGTPVMTVGAGVSYWFDGSKTNGQTYYYKVRAMNGAILSQFSDETSAIPGPGSAPAAPTDLMATPTSDGPGITLKYEASSNITLWYEVFRGNSSGAESTTPIANITSFSKSIFLAWADDTAVPDVNYYYTVKVANMYGWSAASNEVSSFNSPTGDRPDPVSGVIASGGAGMITVSWSSPTYQGTATVLVYTIYRNITSGWEAVGLDGTGLGATSWVDHFVLPGVTYTYKVMVTNIYGEAIALSNPASASASAAATVPSVPLNLHATSGTGYVLLGWDAPVSNGGAAITGYDVWRGTTLGSITSMIGSTTGALTFNDTTAAAGIQYYYAVTADNSVGSSLASNVVTGMSTAPVPSAPLNLTAVGHNGYVLLNWLAPTNLGSPALSQYSIWRGASAGSLTWLANVTAGTLSYNDTTVTNNQTYVYAVKAVNTLGSGPASNTASAMPSVSGTAPGVPTGLIAIGQIGQISLNWTAPANSGSGVSNYLVYRGATAGGEGTVPIAKVTGTTYIDVSATPGTLYYYTVKANNSAGMSPASNEATATAASPTAPSAPQNFMAVSSSNGVTLTWTVPASSGGSSILDYTIYRSYAGGAYSLIGTVPAGTTTYVDMNGTIGYAYSYYVVAVNSVGAGAQPSTQSATYGTSGAAPYDYTWVYVLIVIVIIVIILLVLWWSMRSKKTTPPQNLMAQSGTGSIRLTWEMPANQRSSSIKSYEVLRGTESGKETRLTSVTGLTYNDTTAMPGTRYFYVVKAVYSAGYSSSSNEVTGTATAPIKTP